MSSFLFQKKFIQDPTIAEMINYILKEIMGDNFPADEIIKNNE